MEGAGATRSIEPAVRRAVALVTVLICSTAGVAGAQVSGRSVDQGSSGAGAAVAPPGHPRPASDGATRSSTMSRDIDRSRMRYPPPAP